MLAEERITVSDFTPTYISRYTERLSGASFVANLTDFDAGLLLRNDLLFEPLVVAALPAAAVAAVVVVVVVPTLLSSSSPSAETTTLLFVGSMFALLRFSDAELVRRRRRDADAALAAVVVVVVVAEVGVVVDIESGDECEFDAVDDGVCVAVPLVLSPPEPPSGVERRGERIDS